VQDGVRLLLQLLNGLRVDRPMPSALAGSRPVRRLGPERVATAECEPAPETSGSGRPSSVRPKSLGFYDQKEMSEGGTDAGARYQQQNRYRLN
jgi:hypothetical protein